jgi:hypothetical protein
MKHSVELKILSLLTLLLMIVHLTQDFIRQTDRVNLYPIPVVVFALWLYGTLVLSDRVWGYVIMLFGGLIGAGMIMLHSRGMAISPSGGFFFVWTLFAVSTSGWVTAILSAGGLWTKFRSRHATRVAAAPGTTAL